MKRGWIAWDRAELPPAVFESRLDRARHALAERDLPALVVYTDVWRANQARYCTNYMPYWNRALLVVPRDAPAILLCALSPRVYPWIRSMTVIGDVRPAPNLAGALVRLASEQGWPVIGIVDRERLPHDLHGSLCVGPLASVDIPFAAIAGADVDEAELGMRRRAADIARRILSAQLPEGRGKVDHQFVGGLERALRLAGAEDVVILLSGGDTTPAPAAGTVLGERYSVTLAMEYRGHWVKLSRAQGPPAAVAAIRARFHQLLQVWPDVAALSRSDEVVVDRLSGPYPYEPCTAADLDPASLFAVQVEADAAGRRLFHGDTCRFGEKGAEPL